MLNAQKKKTVRNQNIMRILSIDFGEKRTGLAVTDPLRIIANGLTTVDTPNLKAYLSDYFSREEVDTVVIGYPKTLRNELAKVVEKIDKFLDWLTAEYPEMKVVKVDERFTSKLAFQTMIESGIGKKARQNKALIDQISATIILQSYLESL